MFEKDTPDPECNYRKINREDIRGRVNDVYDEKYVVEIIDEANTERQKLREAGDVAATFSKETADVDVELIRKMNEVITTIATKESERLGLEAFDISFLKDGPIEYSEYLVDGLGQYVSSKDQIKMQEPKDVNREAELWYTLLHETIHRLSKTDFHITDNGYGPAVRERKVGFLTAPKNQNSISSSKPMFNALNEGAVEGYTRFLVHTYRDLILEALSELSPEQLNAYEAQLLHYNPEVTLVNNITHGLAAWKEIPFEQQRDEIVRNHFLGNLMWTRDIERCFGPGSLNILSKLHPHHNHENLYAYFDETDADARLKKGIDLRITNTYLDDHESVIEYLKAFNGMTEHYPALIEALEHLIWRCKNETTERRPGDFLYEKRKEISIAHYQSAVEKLQAELESEM